MGFEPMTSTIEHRSGIVEIMGSNPVEASDFFLCNCLSCFTTVKITFTSIK